MPSLWGLSSVPQNGWVCEGHYRASQLQICEMCSRQEIRYVHIMHHDDFPRTLEVGCVCAGHMEGDLDAARNREKTTKRLEGQRFVEPAKSEEAQTWVRAADKILEKGGLSEKEEKFIKDMRWKFNGLRGFEPSKKQSDWFVAIYRRVVE
jgi:hypothetical protein